MKRLGFWLHSGSRTDHQRSILFLAALWVLASCQLTAPNAKVPPLEAPGTIVVDAFASLNGDGSASFPFKTLPTRVLPGTHIQMRAGLYRGPFSLPKDIVLEGNGEVVLFVEGNDAAVVEAQGPLTLRSLSVQGGSVGLRGQGSPLSLERVHFSGHRSAAIEAGPASKLSALDCVFKGLSSTSRGIIATGAQVVLDHVVFQGAFGRAVEAVRSDVRIEHGVFEGPQTALHAVSSTSLVSETSARAGSGPAFFASKGVLELQSVSVSGHEYSVQTGMGTTLIVDGLKASRPLLAAVAMVQTKATLTHLVLESSGSMGAVQAIDCELVFTDSTITGSRSSGLLIRKGTAWLAELRFAGVQSETERDGSHSLGDAMHIRDAAVTMKRVVVSDAEGTSLYVTAGAKVSVDELVSERAGEGALLVERNSEVTAHLIRASESAAPAVAVIDGASLTLDQLMVTGSTTPLWAECNERVSVKLGSVQPVSGKLPPCVIRQ